MMSGQMELELGLAPPDHNPMMIEGLDLNSCCSNINGSFENTGNYDFQQKRSFLDVDHDSGAIEEVESRLSLLLWSGGRQQDQEEDGSHRPKSRRLQVNHDRIDNEENQEIEGWPPIYSSRNELPHRHQGGFPATEQMRNSMYVKVKMEGVAIGRKIDLRHYHSYEDLTNTLIDMFAKYISTIDRKRENYILMYQDKEGEWMLAGDVQWERFMESARRLEILKDNNMGFRLLSTV